MAMNMEAVLRIAAKTVGLEEITKLEKAIGGAEKAASSAKTSFAAVVNSATWQAAAAGAAGIGVALGTSVRAAIDFESAMADVRKVVPGLESAEGLKEMKQEIIGLSKELPVSAEGLAAIMAAAGQSGIPREELAEFTRQAAQMGVAFDITADEAGTAMAKLRTSLGLSQPEVVDLADAMNFLSNNMASSAAEVSNFMLRAGAVGKQVAMTTEQTAALGSAMIAAGAEPEVAATSFRNLIKALTKGESATAKQAAAFKTLGLDVNQVAKDMQTDAVGTIRDVFQRISQMPAEMRVSTISEVFGDEARAITPLITNMQLFDQAIGLVGDKSQYAGSMLAEFEARAGTSANNFQLLQNNIKALQIAIGEGLLPALNLMLGTLAPVLSVVADLAGRFPLLTAVVVTLTAALAGLVILAPAIVSLITLLGSLKAMLAISSLAVGWAGLQTVVIVAVAAMKGALLGFIGWVGSVFIPGLLAFLGPVGWTVLAIAAVVAMAIAFRKPIMEFLGWLAGKLAEGAKTIGAWALQIPQFMVSAWTAARDAIRSFFAWFAGALVDGIKVLWDLGEPIREFWVGAWDAVKEVVTGFFAWLGPAIGQGLQALWQWGEPIREFWAGVWDGLRGAVTAYFGFVRTAFDVGLKVAWAVVDTLLIRPWMALWEILIRRPASAAVDWLRSNVFQPLTQSFGELVVKPIQAGWATLVQALPRLLSAAAGLLRTSWDAITDSFSTYVVAPIQRAWTALAQGLDAAIRSVVQLINSAWNSLAQAFNTYLVGPVSNAWVALMNSIGDLMVGASNAIVGAWNSLGQGFRQYVAEPIASAWQTVIEFMPRAMRSVADFVQGIWTGMIESIQSAVRGMLQYVASRINTVAGLINRLIKAFNALPGSDIPLIPTITVPAFAEGGIVSRPTLAMVGEGGEREYIIPESKMQAASSRFLAGQRGADVIPSTAASDAGSTTTRRAQINITTGPVLQQADGSRWVSVDDFERGLQRVAERVFDDLRRPEARLALGGL
jgi:TP901 family phage tail tape measure protein